MKILITEDNPDMLTELKRLLSQNDISTATDLQSGLDKINERPDLLLTDWDLGAGDTSSDLIEKALQIGVEVIIHTGESRNELLKIMDRYKDEKLVSIIPKNRDSIKELESAVQKRRLP